MLRWIPVLITLFALGCHTSSAPTTMPLMKASDNQPGGATTRTLSNTAPRGMTRYAYTVMDDAGTSVIKGTMTLPDPLPTSGTFQGTWVASYFSNDEVPPTAHLGPQVGEGKVVGVASNSELHLELNPGMADHNVAFHLKIESSEMNGDWTFATYAGITGRGTIAGHRE